MSASATCDGRAESDAGISKKKTELISMDGVGLQSQVSQCVFNLQEDFRAFSSSLIVERWRAEHQLQFPMSRMALVHMYRSELGARSGRREVAVRRR